RGWVAAGTWPARCGRGAHTFQCPPRPFSRSTSHSHAPPSVRMVPRSLVWTRSRNWPKLARDSEASWLVPITRGGRRYVMVLVCPYFCSVLSVSVWFNLFDVLI